MGVLGFCLWVEWLRKILGGLIDCKRRRCWVLFFFLLAEIGANLGCLGFVVLDFNNKGKFGKYIYSNT
jgi:hypothetical protein